jgi:parallel beta-helix repeat protein
MKPLDQVEPRMAITSLPYTISTSGSYYLVKNLSHTGSGTAITISANDVTLDLCGFELSGASSADGIAPGGRSNVIIKNGTIRGFNFQINEANSVSKNLVIRNINGSGPFNRHISVKDKVTITDCVLDGGVYSIVAGAGCRIARNTCTGAGMAVFVGKDSIIEDNVFTSNNSSIQTGDNCVIIGNAINNHTSTGLATGSNCLIKNNTIIKCYQYGISAGSNCRMESNVINNVNGDGINGSTQTHCEIVNCNITACTGDGIELGTNTSVKGSTVNSNGGKGIFVAADSKVVDCTVSNNTQDGINAGDRCTLTGNNVTSNGITGIYCFGGYVARNNVMLNNTTATVGKGGIVVERHSQVKENTLEGNAKNNIYVAQYRNCIEGNVMSGSDYGINFGSTGNIYLNNRGTCNGVNYNAAGNADGGGNLTF